MSHAILFRDFPLDNLDVVAPAVARVCGLNDYDARAKIRRGWGFLERDVAAEVAERIAGELPGVKVIANSQLREPGKATVITGYAADAVAFTPRLQSPTAMPRAIPWAEIAIVAAGSFSEDIVRRDAGGKDQSLGQVALGLGVFMATGIPVGLKRPKKEEKRAKTTRTISFGRVITTFGEQYMFQPEHFDFAALGDQKQLNAGGNLRAFIHDFHRRTPARLNLGARYLLANQSMTLANYTGLRDFETELLWLFNAA